MIDLDDLLRATAAQGSALAGRAFARSFSAFAHDSRTVSPGDLFVALRSPTGDGHAFIADAVARGAAGVLCERLPEGRDGWAAGVTVVRVADTRTALRDFAAARLRELRPYRIAVVGAVGKSSARAALLRALGAPEGGPEVFSNGNRNDELGLPLALGELLPGQRTAVLELAAASGAELLRLGELVRPDAVLLTAGAPPAANDSPSVALRDGLAGLLDSAQPGGLIVLNGDDTDLARQLAEAGAAASRRLLRYGLDAAAELAGTVLEESAAGSLLELRYGEAVARVRLQAPGRGAVYAALAAAAMAVACGYALDDAAARLDGLPPEPGRLAPLSGRDGLAVLDDSFSASAVSLRLALETLASFPPPHRAVLGEVAGVRHAEDLDAETLGRLLALDRLVLQGRELAALGRELRSRSDDPQRIMLTYSARDSADAVVGPHAPAAWPSPPAPLPSGSSDRIDEMGEGRASATLLTTPSRVLISPSPVIGGRGRGMGAKSGLGSRSEGGGTVLVKGTDAARMERVVELLLPEVGRGGARLVRQDEGWRRRTYVPGERPTWVEVDLEAIRQNLLAVRAAAAPAEVMAVLKADAYGHGARWVARTAALNGAAMLGVASLNEALELRADGIATPILILGYAPPWQARDLALSEIRATLFSLPVAEHFSRVARDLGREIAVHVKVDTGMTRLGVLPPDVPAFVDAVAALPGLRLEGIFSHMATSDTDVDFAIEQGERFDTVLRGLERRGHRFRYVHMENSAAVLRGLPFAGNLVRAGLALYGLYPLPREETSIELRPAMQFKTRVAQVKEVPPGTAISYGRTYVTERTSRIAILPVGYGDGFRRSPRNWGHVLVRGQRAPIRGVVAMDMTMVDVTEIPGVQEGDEVVLIGRQGDEAITAKDAAAALGTIPYEVITQILARVPRQTH